MKSTLSETNKLELLLELVREARQKIERGEQPKLRGRLEEKGLSKEDISKLIKDWAQLITETLDEEPQKTVILSERKEALQSSALRLLFSCLVPSFSARLADETQSDQSPENERRARIQVTSEEIRNLLETSLIDQAWAK